MLILCVIVTFVLFVVFRVGAFILSYPRVHQLRCDVFTDDEDRPPISAMVVLGSGGHTTEMLRMLGAMRKGGFDPLVFVIAETDVHSHNRLKEKFPEAKHIERLPRSREVGQSYLTSVLTTLYATWFCLPLLWRYRPSVLLVNGPGTCVPLCVVVAILGLLGIHRTHIVFVESICRVETLSLSGKILQYFADAVLVQWQMLADKYPRTLFIDRVV